MLYFIGFFQQSKPYISIEIHMWTIFFQTWFFLIPSKNRKCVNQRIDNSQHRQSNRLTSFDFKIRWNECESECVCASIGVYVETFQWNRLLIRHKLRNYAFMAKYYSSIFFLFFSSLRSTNIDAVALMLVFFTLHSVTQTHLHTCCALWCCDCKWQRSKMWIN